MTFTPMSGPWTRAPSKTCLTLENVLILIDNFHPNQFYPFSDNKNVYTNYKRIKWGSY